METLLKELGADSFEKPAYLRQAHAKGEITRTEMERIISRADDIVADKKAQRDEDEENEAQYWAEQAERAKTDGLKYAQGL